MGHKMGKLWNAEKTTFFVDAFYEQTIRTFRRVGCAMFEAKKSGLRDVIELVTKAEELIKDYCRELKLLNQWQLLMVQDFLISSIKT